MTLLALDHSTPVIAALFAVFVLAFKIPPKRRFWIWILVGVVFLLSVDPSQSLLKTINENMAIIAVIFTALVHALELRWRVMRHEKQLENVESMKTDLTIVKNDLHWIKENLQK